MVSNVMSWLIRTGCLSIIIDELITNFFLRRILLYNCRNTTTVLTMTRELQENPILQQRRKNGNKDSQQNNIRRINNKMPIDLTRFVQTERTQYKPANQSKQESLINIYDPNIISCVLTYQLDYADLCVYQRSLSDNSVYPSDNLKHVIVILLRNTRVEKKCFKVIQRIFIL